jgi:hypothetical protein
MSIIQKFNFLPSWIYRKAGYTVVQSYSLDWILDYWKLTTQNYDSEYIQQNNIRVIHPVHVYWLNSKCRIVIFKKN